MLNIQHVEKRGQRSVASESDLKVMIVDDDTELMGTLRYALDSCGFQVTSCENGTEALLSSMLEEFDFIVIDYDMPGMDGLELTRRLREKYSRVVIIGISGTDREEAFFDAGANDFLRKPFVPYRLAMMIDGGDILA